MSQLLPTIIVSLILAGVVALAVRSLWQSHKSGGHCNGDCGTCGGGAADTTLAAAPTLRSKICI